MVEPCQENRAMMDTILVEISPMPYRVWCGRVLIECETADEAIRLANRNSGHDAMERPSP